MRPSRRAATADDMFEEMSSREAAEAARRARQREQEEALAAELDRRRREAEAKEREIQRICESDPGLRELQEKLKVRR